MNKVLLVIVAFFLLSACGVSETRLSPTQIEKVVLVATETLVPTPIPTPSPTEAVIPDFMNEFIELGYDKQSLGKSSFYVVYDEASTVYADDEFGLRYKTSAIISWTKVYFIENDLLVSAYVFNDVCTESKTDGKEYICLLVLGNSANYVPFPPSIKFDLSILTQVYERTDGDYSIWQIELDSQNSHAPSVFEDLFPAFAGKIEFIEIPKIGKVIPAQYLTYYKVVK